MRSLLPLAAAGGAGMLWHTLPRWVKIPAVVGLVALGAIELNKDSNESWFSSAIYSGQASEGESKSVDPRQTEADAAAGKPVSGAALMMAKQVEGLGADALLKQAQAEAASLTEAQLLARKRAGTANMTDAMAIESLKKAKAEAEQAEAMATAARAQALAEKQIAEVNSKIIESMNNGSFLDTMIDLSGIRAALPDVPRFSGKR